MEHADTVTVFAFQTYDALAESYRISHFKAPRELIGSRFEGDVLEGTAEEVEAAALDEQGRYRRVATGWGALN